jgi:hypothetical protein
MAAHRPVGEVGGLLGRPAGLGDDGVGAVRIGPGDNPLMSNAT